MPILSRTCPKRRDGLYEDIEIINGWIDSGLPEVYRAQPLARDWARVAIACSLFATCG